MAFKSRPEFFSFEGHLQKAAMNSNQVSAMKTSIGTKGNWKKQENTCFFMVYDPFWFVVVFKKVVSMINSVSRKGILSYFRVQSKM